MSNLDKYAAKVAELQLMQEALNNPEKINDAADAIVKAYALTDAEIAKRNEYNDIINGANSAIEENKKLLADIDAKQTKLDASLKLLAADQLALTAGQNELKSNQDHLALDQKILATSQTTLEAAQKELEEERAQFVVDKQAVEVREGAVTARENKIKDALAQANSSA